MGEEAALSEPRQAERESGRPLTRNALVPPLPQFVRFLIIGALNTAFGYGVFAALILLHVPPMPALVATYVIGACFNFWTTGRLVFAHTAARAFLPFLLAYVVIYGFNAALFQLVASGGFPALVTQAICLPLVAVFSFILFKFHVFRQVT